MKTLVGIAGLIWGVLFTAFGLFLAWNGHGLKISLGDAADIVLVASWLVIAAAIVVGLRGLWRSRRRRNHVKLWARHVAPVLRERRLIAEADAYNDRYTRALG